MTRRVGACLLVSALAILGCERPPVEAEQLNFRGLAQEQVVNPRLQRAKLMANEVPEPIPPVPTEGPRAADVYQNVQVLGDLSVNEFNRLMAAITQWVSPEQGCTYCHVGNLAEDNVYTKVVARGMLKMTQAINTGWQSHVGNTGVTCYTCHRGQPVPANYWVTDADAGEARMIGYNAGQNSPATAAGLASLPADPFTPYLSTAEHTPIRVQSGSALPNGNGSSIKQTEHTYALMMHLSTSLGVNCGYCHNSRAFAPWEESLPTRVTAWHGLRMVRDINEAHITPLTDVFPENRKGPDGDVFKANCATCHQGLPKPLQGVSMLADYPNLARPPAP